MTASDPQKKKPKGAPKPPKATKSEFKPKRKPIESKQPQGLPLAVEDDVPDFPRGLHSIFVWVITQLCDFSRFRVIWIDS